MLLRVNTRPSRLRAEVPENRDDRSASSIRLSGRVEMIDQQRLTQHGRRHDVEQFGESPFADRPHDGQLLEELVQQFDRGRALPHARRRPRPAQNESAALVPAALETERGRERNRLFERLPLFGGGLGARQPRIDQDGQVLLVLLLEFLDHQLAAAGRRPPMDPARAVAGPVIAQPVVFHLLRRTVMPLAAPVLGRLALHLKPATGQMADLGINQHLVRTARS